MLTEYFDTKLYSSQKESIIKDILGENVKRQMSKKLELDIDFCNFLDDKASEHMRVKDYTDLRVTKVFTDQTYRAETTDDLNAIAELEAFKELFESHEVSHGLHDHLDKELELQSIVREQENDFNHINLSKINSRFELKKRLSIFYQ